MFSSAVTSIIRITVLTSGRSALSHLSFLVPICCCCRQPQPPCTAQDDQKLSQRENKHDLLIDLCATTQIYVVLKIKQRASYILGRHFTNWAIFPTHVNFLCLSHLWKSAPRYMDAKMGFIVAVILHLWRCDLFEVHLGAGTLIQWLMVPWYGSKWNFIS